MENKTFDAGEKIYVNFRDFRIRGTRETEFEGETTLHTYISMPGTSAFKGYHLDYTNLVWDQQVKDKTTGERKTAEGWKTIRLYENAEYSLRFTPKNPDGSYDYEHQKVVKIKGGDLARELDSWRKDNGRSKDELAEEAEAETESEPEPAFE